MIMQYNKYLVVKEKNLIGILIFQEMQIAKFYETPLQKYSENVYPHSCVSEHFEHFLFFPYKNFRAIKKKRTFFFILLPFKNKNYFILDNLSKYGQWT